MNIKLENLAPGRVLRITGPRCDVALRDDGQAIVTMTLSIGDGTHFHYPTEAPNGSPQSTTLAPGDHDAVLRISVLKMKRFGRSYDSKVAINGVLIATADGSLPEDAEDETGVRTFLVRVGPA